MTLRPLAVTVKKGCDLFATKTLLLSSRWVKTEIELGCYCISRKVTDNCWFPISHFEKVSYGKTLSKGDDVSLLFIFSDSLIER